MGEREGANAEQLGPPAKERPSRKFSLLGGVSAQRDHLAAFEYLEAARIDRLAVGLRTAAGPLRQR